MALRVVNRMVDEAAARVKTFEQTCEQHQAVREEAMQRLLTRRAQVREVVNRCCVKEGTALQDTRLVQAQWLHDWANEVAVPEMDNSSLTCVHSKLHHIRCHGAHDHRSC